MAISFDQYQDMIAAYRELKRRFVFSSVLRERNAGFELIRGQRARQSLMPYFPFALLVGPQTMEYNPASHNSAVLQGGLGPVWQPHANVEHGVISLSGSSGNLEEYYDICSDNQAMFRALNRHIQDDESLRILEGNRFLATRDKPVGEFLNRFVSVMSEIVDTESARRKTYLMLKAWAEEPDKVESNDETYVNWKILDLANDMYPLGKRYYGLVESFDESNSAADGGAFRKYDRNLSFRIFDEETNDFFQPGVPVQTPAQTSASETIQLTPQVIEFEVPESPSFSAPNVPAPAIITDQACIESSSVGWNCSGAGGSIDFSCRPDSNGADSVTDNRAASIQSGQYEEILYRARAEIVLSLDSSDVQNIAARISTTSGTSNLENPPGPMVAVIEVSDPEGSAPDGKPAWTNMAGGFQPNRSWRIDLAGLEPDHQYEVELQIISSSQFFTDSSVYRLNVNVGSACSEPAPNANLHSIHTYFSPCQNVAEVILIFDRPTIVVNPAAVVTRFSGNFNSRQSTSLLLLQQSIDDGQIDPFTGEPLASIEAFSQQPRWEKVIQQFQRVQAANPDINVIDADGNFISESVFRLVYNFGEQPIIGRSARSGLVQISIAANLLNEFSRPSPPTEYNLEATPVTFLSSTTKSLAAVEESINVGGNTFDYLTYGFEVNPPSSDVLPRVSNIFIRGNQLTGPIRNWRDVTDRVYDNLDLQDLKPGNGIDVMVLYDRPFSLFTFQDISGTIDIFQSLVRFSSSPSVVFGLPRDVQASARLAPSIETSAIFPGSDNFDVSSFNVLQDFIEDTNIKSWSDNQLIYLDIKDIKSFQSLQVILDTRSDVAELAAPDCVYQSALGGSFRLSTTGQLCAQVDVGSVDVTSVIDKTREYQFSVLIPSASFKPADVVKNIGLNKLRQGQFEPVAEDQYNVRFVSSRGQRRFFNISLVGTNFGTASQWQVVFDQPQCPAGQQVVSFNVQRVDDSCDFFETELAKVRNRSNLTQNITISRNFTVSHDESQSLVDVPDDFYDANRIPVVADEVRLPQRDTDGILFNVTFDFSESATSALDQDSLETLELLSDVLRSAPTIPDITIDGHTDRCYRERVQVGSGEDLDQTNNDPFGLTRFNYNLGLDRANTIRDELISDGVPAANISTRSWGETFPVGIQPGQTATQAYLNGSVADSDCNGGSSADQTRRVHRRVEIIVHC